MTYIKRVAEKTISEISKMFPVVLVTGPRQVGKTTILQKLADQEKGGFLAYWFTSLQTYAKRQ